MTPDDRAIFDAAHRGLANVYARHESKRESAASQAEADLCGRRMAVVRAAIEGVRDLRSEVEAETSAGDGFHTDGRDL